MDSCQNNVDFSASQVAIRYGVPVEHQRFWTWPKQQNRAERPQRILTAEVDELQLVELRNFREQSAPETKHALLELRFYLETPPQGECAWQ